MTPTSDSPKPDAPAALTLEKRLDFAACANLAEALNGARHADLTITARDVEFAGMLGVQLLLSAQMQWQQDGHRFVIAAPSPAFREGFALMGFADLPFNEVTDT